MHNHSLAHAYGFVHLCNNYGINQYVVSPGSRNTPLLRAIAALAPNATVHTHIDERVAAYIGLGIAKVTRKPVVLCCTSGTAAANYYPAVIEAYYQQLPLLIATADRPQERINMADGQAIMQNGLYGHYVTASLTVPEPLTDSLLKLAERNINTALNQVTSPYNGPVHLNFPFSEPLYVAPVFEASQWNTIALNAGKPNMLPTAAHIETWKAARKITLVIGENMVNIDDALLRLSNDHRIEFYAEPLSNVKLNGFYYNPEVVLHAERQITEPTTDLIVTLGGPVLSKTLKQYLQKAKAIHWHVGTNNDFADVFKLLRAQFYTTDLNAWLNSLPIIVNNTSKPTIATTSFKYPTVIAQEGKCFYNVLSALSPETQVFLGNSLPVRHAIWQHWNSHTYHGNRGTSGIDGCTATAIGMAAAATDKAWVLITGDVSFWYDSNALLYQPMPKNLKIVVLNNGGGKIFETIKGPTTVPYFEERIKTPVSYSISNFLANCNLQVFATNPQQLDKVLPLWMNEKGAALVIDLT